MILKLHTMKNKNLHILIAALILSSCSTAYKTTQTPDDVYYSPAKEVPGGDDYNNPPPSSADDNYLRMKAHNHTVWSSIDDYSYWNDSRYDFGYSCTPSRYEFINSFNMYPFGWNYGYGLYGYGWNGWNSPHGTVVFYKNPQVYFGNTTKTNLTAYGNHIYNNQNNQDGLFKRIFTGNNANNNYSNTNGNNPSRTFNSGTGTNNSAGGRSGGYHSSGSSASSPRPPRPPL